MQLKQAIKITYLIDICKNKRYNYSNKSNIFQLRKNLKYKESDYETKTKQRKCVGIAFCGNGMLHDAAAGFGGESRGKH